MPPQRLQQRSSRAGATAARRPNADQKSSCSEPRV
jgi:hypothetical protein